MTGMEQLDQVLLPDEIGGSIKLSGGIVNPFRTHEANQNDPTIRPSIIQYNQSIGPGHIDWIYSPPREFVYWY